MRKSYYIETLAGDRYTRTGTKWWRQRGALISAPWIVDLLDTLYVLTEQDRRARMAAQGGIMSEDVLQKYWDDATKGGVTFSDYEDKAAHVMEHMAEDIAALITEVMALADHVRSRIGKDISLANLSTKLDTIAKGE